MRNPEEVAREWLGLRDDPRGDLAVETIAALLRERDAEHERPAWISVEERLPGFDVPVWLWEPERGVWIGARSDDADGWLWGHCYGEEWWDSLTGEWRTGRVEVDDDYQPTRWHVLPSPPSPAEETSGG